ncbi:TPA: hypothetical protein DDW35_10865 [Candidatus Sumerlaeota bacterium]|nr:hypothetical protein [Candidatus Sumerlaeota bacterium]
MQRCSVFVLLILISLTFAACNSFDGDKVYIPDTQYETAKRIYNETGSVQLTAGRLKELHWRSGEINEAVYRLTKQYEINKN